MQVSEIYDKLGGREKAAELCGVSSWATRKWDRKGVPAKHWRIIARELEIPLDVVAATAAPAKRKRKRPSIKSAPPGDA